MRLYFIIQIPEIQPTPHQNKLKDTKPTTDITLHIKTIQTSNPLVTSRK